MIAETLKNLDSSQTSLPTVSSPKADIVTTESYSDTPPPGVADQPFIHIDDILPSKESNSNDDHTLKTNYYIPSDKPKEEISDPVLFSIKKPLIQERFILLQKWECVVDQMMEDFFIARLVDQTGKSPDEVAEFMFDEVSPADRNLLVPNAIFYWYIGYEESIGGQRKRSSIIRFRRLPTWSAYELEKAQHDADRTRDTLNWK